MQAHRGIAHVAFEFSFGDESGDGVNDHDVDGVRANQFLRDFESLFAVIRLRDEKIVHVHAEFARVDGVQRMLGVDERRLATELLRFGDNLKREGGLTSRFRAINLNDASARKAADAKRGVNRKASGRDHVHGHQNVLAAQPHDGALTVRLFDYGYRVF